jgi:hypothetical protein
LIVRLTARKPLPPDCRVFWCSDLTEKGDTKKRKKGKTEIQKFRNYYFEFLIPNFFISYFLIPFLGVSGSPRRNCKGTAAV